MTFEQMLVGVFVPAVVGAVVYVVRLSAAPSSLRKELEERGVRVEEHDAALGYQASALIPEHLRSAEWSARVGEPVFALFASGSFPIATWRSSTPINGRWAMQKLFLPVTPPSFSAAGLAVVQGGWLSGDCLVWSDSDARPSKALQAWCRRLRKGHDEWTLLCDNGTFYWFSDNRGAPCSFAEYCSIVRAVEQATRGT